MKRLGNIFHEICSLDNLRLADKKARKGKLTQLGVKQFDRNAETNLFLLHDALLNRTFRTSEYKVFKIKDPKEREVHRLPYYPDRIVHHAVMNRLESMFMANFTADTFSCIKGKGIHGASYQLRKALQDTKNTQFCLKLDIKKFYHSVNHAILKALVRRKIKDKDLLWLLDEIIDSAEGLPIGNYLSQYLANYYLSPMDHWIKETLRVKHYFRYADDIVILGNNKKDLHAVLAQIREHMKVNLKLQVKENYQVFPVSSRGIDFVGYVHYHEVVYLRKGIKKRLCKAVLNGGNHLSAASYYGWLKHCDSKNLLKKLKMTRFSELNIKPKSNGMEGEKIKIDRVLNKEIKILRYEIKPSKYTEKGNGNCLYMQAEVDGAKRVIFSGSTILMDMIQQAPETAFPITATIVKENDRLEFR